MIKGNVIISVPNFIFHKYIYIKQLWVIPWVIADERLLGRSPVGDVEAPLPLLLGHICGLPGDAGLCQEVWEGEVAQGFEA